MSLDSLGDRMKRYEVVTQQVLPIRTYTIVRIDGRAFHSYTKGYVRPFDQRLMDDMDTVAIELVRQMSGAQIAYVQSDEISILLTDFAELNTQPWFDSNLQKIVSNSASLATGLFNDVHSDYNELIALFDARAFTIPTACEVENYFLWRQQDAERNSLSMLARAHYSHKELVNKRAADMHEMLYQKGVNWANLNTRYKRGGFVYRSPGKGVTYVGAPSFSKERELLRALIPVYV